MKLLTTGKISGEEPIHRTLSKFANVSFLCMLYQWFLKGIVYQVLKLLDGF